MGALTCQLAQAPRAGWTSASLRALESRDVPHLHGRSRDRHLPDGLGSAGAPQLRSDSPAHHRDTIELGALAGGCLLARIDFALPFAVFLLLSLKARRYALLTSAANRRARNTRRQRLVRLGACGHWWLSAKLGGAQRAFLTEWLMGPRVIGALVALIEHLTPWAYTAAALGPIKALATLAALASWIAFSIYCRRAAKTPEAHDEARGFIRACADRSPVVRDWALALLVLPLTYVLFSGLSLLHPLLRSPERDHHPDAGLPALAHRTRARSS